jgi:hypothetical protein
LRKTDKLLPAIHPRKREAKNALIEKFLKFQRVFKVYSTAQRDGVENDFPIDFSLHYAPISI